MKDFKLTTLLPPYIPYCRFLLDMPLNETARIVYSLILSRILLSQSNAWVDEEGRVYCRYTIQNLMADTGKSKSTIVTALGDLEKQKLLYRRRGGAGYANKLYLRVPEFSTSEDRKSAPQMSGKSAPNYKKKENKNDKPDYDYQGDSF